MIITDNADARFDVSIYYTDGRTPWHHTDVSAQVADRLEFAATMDPEVSQVHVAQRAADADQHADSENDEVIKLTADVVLFGDFLDEGRFVLLIEREWDPFKGCYALPGGHADRGEDTQDAAYRELTEETGLRIGPQLKLVNAYQTPGRDPRGRYVTFAYAGRMPHRVEPTAGDDAARAAWVPLDDVLSGAVSVAFDHAQVIRDALNVVPFYHS